MFEVIELKLENTHWIKGSKDDPEDQCAHGNIKFILDDLIISDAQEEWTVSAAALFLLRTVHLDHSENASVAESNYIIPCCGFNPFKIEDDRFQLLLMGCNHGLNPEITHQNGLVSVTHNGQVRTVIKSEWAQAIANFAEEVLSFYRSSSPKLPIEDKLDQEGWGLFWQEFHHRIEEAHNVASNT